MSARIQPAPPPYTASVQAVFDRLMTRQGVAPLALFTTLARDERLYQRFRDGGCSTRGT